jgi:glucosamine--fructose-6-phosphate aminotransferase (isomerizing)
MVGKGFRAIILAADDGTYPQCVKMATDIVRFGGKVVFVTNGSEIAEKDIYSITLECANNELFPISSIIPLQLIVNAWALSKGMIPGSFAKGAKVTVVE